MIIMMVVVIFLVILVKLPKENKKYLTYCNCLWLIDGWTIDILVYKFLGLFKNGYYGGL